MGRRSSRPRRRPPSRAHDARESGPVTRLARVAPLLFLLVVGACDGGDTTTPEQPPVFASTPPALLSARSPTKDEDPSVILARDGSIVVAWFSDRGADPGDLYITRSERGTEWADPVRVTVSPDGDFYPSLYQDDRGVFHLAWFRWYALNRGHIWTNRSGDPLAWDPGREVQVTTTLDVDDWVPSIAQTGDSLRVFFVSESRDAVNPTSDIYTASAHIDSMAWGSATPMTINSPTEHDHLPVAAWTGSELSLVWVRHDTSQPAPWLNPPPTSHLYASASGDGTAWSAAAAVTTDGGAVVNVFPGLYRRRGGAWWLLWLSTRAGAPALYEIPLANLAAYPAGVETNAALPPGYSHRVVRTPVAGLYFGVWVQGPDGAQDVYYRFYQE